MARRLRLDEQPLLGILVGRLAGGVGDEVAAGPLRAGRHVGVEEVGLPLPRLTPPRPARRRDPTTGVGNIHRSDESVFDGETVTDVLVAENGPVQVAHDLRHE